MQVPQFKRRMFIESGVFFAVFIVLAAVTYLLIAISDDYTESNDAIKKKADVLNIELNSLQRKYSFINNNQDLFQEANQKQSEGKLVIKRQAAFDKFNTFRTQFYLSNLRLTVSPVQEIKDPKFKRPTSFTSSSEINVETDVLYDENVFQLIKAMETDLPGLSIVSRFNISLTRPVNAEVLQTIGSKGTYPLIKSAFKFTWFSINPVEVVDPNDPTKK